MHVETVEECESAANDNSDCKGSVGQMRVQKKLPL